MGDARALAAVAPDRLVWGSDRPHATEEERKPDDARLLDLLAEWVPDAATRRTILVDNPGPPTASPDAPATSIHFFESEFPCIPRAERSAFFSLPLLISLLALAPRAQAQADYPNRPVKLIVPIAAGQATDILARLVADQLARSLGQTFVVENKAGAGGAIGTDFVAKAAPDGYTLVLATSAGFAVARRAIYAKLPYDPVRELRAGDQRGPW